MTSLDAVTRALRGQKFWVATSRGWAPIAPNEVAKLLTVRLDNPLRGAELLLEGSIFKPTPSSTIRTQPGLAPETPKAKPTPTPVRIFRVEEPRKRA